MNDCYKPLDGGALGCTDPEIVVLSGQTIDEVNKIIDHDKKYFDEINTLAGVKKKFPEFFEETNEPKLCFEDEFASCFEQPVLGHGRRKPLEKDLPEFVMWRHLSGVGTEDEVDLDWGPAQDLMDILLVKLKRNFPKIDFSWSAELSEGWGHCLKIENQPTKITARSLAKALEGLGEVVNINQAQAVIIQLLIKKLRELFA